MTTFNPRSIYDWCLQAGAVAMCGVLAATMPDPGTYLTGLCANITRVQRAEIASVHCDRVPPYGCLSLRRSEVYRDAEAAVCLPTPETDASPNIV